MAQWQGKKLFVPYTLTGDVVQVRLVQHTKEFVRGVPVAIVTPGPERAAPSCPHFQTCGGCLLQHMSEGAYHAYKQSIAEHAVKKAGFSSGGIRPLVRVGPLTRRRATFSVKQGVLGYQERRGHTVLEITSCDVMSPSLMRIYGWLRDHLVLQDGQILVNLADEGADILIESTALPVMRGVIPSIVARITHKWLDGYSVLTEQKGGPYHTLPNGIRVALPPGAFLQATIEAERVMVEEILRQSHIGKWRKALDLFCGIGTYALPVWHTGVGVTAIEQNATMVEAAIRAVRRHDLQHAARFRGQVRDLFAHPLTSEELQEYDGVILNPPRVGAVAQCETIAQSRIRHCVMISCNHSTFTRDARVLKEHGFNLALLLPIDQFLYSAHLELVAVFTRNS